MGVVNAVNALKYRRYSKIFDVHEDIDQPYIDDSNATINDSPSYESKEVSDRDFFRFENQF